MPRDPALSTLDPQSAELGSTLQAVLRRVNRDQAAQRSGLRRLRRMARSAAPGQQPQQVGALIDAALRRRTQVLLAPALPARLTRTHPFDLPWTPSSSAMPKLFLPGLHSVAKADRSPGTGYGRKSELGALTWTWKHRFLDRFCRKVAGSWAALRGELLGAPWTASWLPEVSLPALSSLAGGIDLHWYHFHAREETEGDGTETGDENSRMGLLHAGWLMVDVAAVVDLLEAYGIEGRVTVVETSSSSDRSNGAQVAPGKEVDEGITDEEAQAFQASEIWRRSLASRAGGAEKSGHHPWAFLDDTWKGCGLRHTPDPTSESAVKATAKPAWFAFHRVGLLLRDAGPVRLLVPSSLPPRSLLRLAEPGLNSHWILTPVLAFEVPELSVPMLGETPTSHLRYAYVVMVDPTAPSEGPYTVEVRSPHGTPGELRRLEPWTERPADWLVLPPEGEDDATRLPQYRADESIGSLERILASGATTAFSLGRGDPPLILLSPDPLELSLRED